MTYYEQSFQRLYENFVFSLTIYRDDYHKKLLLNQMLEKAEQTYQIYKKLGLPTYQLAQWKKHYVYKMKRAYLTKGEKS